MNVSYEWLKAFVSFDETPAQLRELITAHVATVDDLVALRTDLAPIVVARVVEEAPHPDSDHLHVTKVDMGTGELLDVVCGAPNVTAGKLYPFAPSGTTMPNGLKIEKRRIRGAVSNGMLCSPSELLLGDDHSGILELTTDAPPGTPFLRVMPVGDMRLVVDVGANRPDLLSHLGIAREIAAVTGRPLALPSILMDSIPLVFHGAVPIEVRVDDPALVNRFMGVVIRGVAVGPSPDWLRERIESVGGRSINNVVDASNYVLHELGQPTHAFDLARLAGQSVVVRTARQGERIVTLDGQERALTDDMIVIADSERPQAIAGIMGGRDSEVTAETKDIFLEVANFDRRRIRSARRSLGLATDASYRFERGVDVEIATVALERVAAIILATAGGRIDGNRADIRPLPSTRREIVLRLSRVERVLGARVEAAEIAPRLTAIGFTATGQKATSDELKLLVPSWREDVSAEIDMIEEVARLRGYDSFPDTINPFRPGTVSNDPAWIATTRIREQLVGMGLLETRAMPFVIGGEGFVRVRNPLAENEAYLRREVLDTLARRAEFNLAHMQGDLRLFEIGAVFAPSAVAGSLPIEELRVGVLVMGRRSPRHFTDPKSKDVETSATFDAWDVKGLAEEIARTAYPGRAITLVDPSTDTRRPERSERVPASAGAAFSGSADPGTQALRDSMVAWLVAVDGKTVGRVGRVSLDAPVWAAPAWGVELSLGVVESAPVAAPGASARVDTKREGRTHGAYRPLPSTPASIFDLALSVPIELASSAVEGVIRKSAGDILERLELFDVYEGPGVEEGRRSLAWRLTFRHPERTLREKEIDARRAKIVAALDSELHVRHRTS